MTQIFVFTSTFSIVKTKVYKTRKVLFQCKKILKIKKVYSKIKIIFPYVVLTYILGQKILSQFEYKFFTFFFLYTHNFYKIGHILRNIVHKLFLSAFVMWTKKE